MNTTQMYDVQAGSIRVEEIATNDDNRSVLNRMKRNNASDNKTEYLWIQNHHDAEDGEESLDYVPEGAYDMGWLGYFVGKNEQLEQLYFRDFEPPSGVSIMEILEPFIRGLNCNKSIWKFNFADMDLLGGRIFTMLGPFFENNPSFIHLSICDCILGDEGWRLLALATGSSKHKSFDTRK